MWTKPRTQNAAISCRMRRSPRSSVTCSSGCQPTSMGSRVTLGARVACGLLAACHGIDP
jgi:hypothetical protein